MNALGAAAIALAAAIVSMNLGAQAPNPPAPAPPATAAPATDKAPAPVRSGASSPADARVCLEFADNLQVIKCAEKYRHLKAPA
jgi:hypothetical protein